MEGVGAAANIIAVVDLSVKVLYLLGQYFRQVAGAKKEIQRLQKQVNSLETALRAAKRLVEGPKGQSLLTSQELSGSFQECIIYLQELEKRLSPRPKAPAMRRLGFRAFKWPFTSSQVEEILTSLERHEKTILFGLQIDQTCASRQKPPANQILTRLIGTPSVTSRTRSTSYRSVRPRTPRFPASLIALCHSHLTPTSFSDLSSGDG